MDIHVFIYMYLFVGASWDPPPCAVCLGARAARQAAAAEDRKPGIDSDPDIDR